MKTLRLHGLSVSIWANQVAGREGPVTYHKAVIAKTYRDQGGEFKTTSSLDADDLLLASFLLTKAHEFIIERQMDAGREPIEA